MDIVGGVQWAIYSTLNLVLVAAAVTSATVLFLGHHVLALVLIVVVAQAAGLGEVRTRLARPRGWRAAG